MSEWAKAAATENTWIKFAIQIENNSKWNLSFFICLFENPFAFV